MSELKVNDVISSLKEMQNENAKLKAMSQNYKNFSDKLKVIATELGEIAKQLDPYTPSRTTSNVDYKTVVADLYDKIKSGTTVDTKFVESTYHTADNSTVYILQKLKSMPGVKVRKEGVRAFLYM